MDTCSKTISFVQERLAQLTHILPEDQIVLCGPPYHRLDPQKPLYLYAIPSPKKKVFMYDRKTLSLDAATLSFPNLIQPQVIQLKSVSSMRSSIVSLSRSSSPLLKALADYENQFQSSAENAHLIQEKSSIQLRACSVSIQEQLFQEEGTNAAISNLHLFRDSLESRFHSFCTAFQDQMEAHEKILSSFTIDCQVLTEIALHPEIIRCLTATSSSNSSSNSSSSGSSRTAVTKKQTKIPQTLSDCIPMEREKTWAEQCSTSYSHIQIKVGELKRLHQSLDAGIEQIAQIGAIFEHKQQMSQQCQLLKSHVDQQEPYPELLYQNFQNVLERLTEATKTLGGTSSSSMMSASSSLTSPNIDFLSSSSHILEACRGLDELWQSQSHYLPEMVKVDQALQEFLKTVNDSKKHVTKRSLVTLQDVSKLQSQIRELNLTLGMLKEALKFLSSQFAELDHVSKLPAAYEASLAEISRRRSYGRMFNEKIRRMGEELAQCRQEEVEARESFLLSFGQHLPRDFVPGLVETPSHCEFRMRPFDQTLPAIDGYNSPALEASLSTSDISSSSLQMSLPNTTTSATESSSTIFESNATEDPRSTSKSVVGSLLLPANPKWNLSMGNDEHEDQANEWKLKYETLQREFEAFKEQNQSELSSMVPVASSVPSPPEEEHHHHKAGFPLLIALAGAADEELGTSLNSCSTASRSALPLQMYQKYIQLLTQQLHDLGVDPLLPTHGSSTMAYDEEEKETVNETLERGSRAEAWRQQEEQMDKLVEELNQKKEMILKYQQEKKQYVLNASAFEQDLQVSQQKEQRMEEKVLKLSATLNTTRLTLDLQSQTLQAIEQLLSTHCYDSKSKESAPLDLTSPTDCNIIISNVTRALKDISAAEALSSHSSHSQIEELHQELHKMEQSHELLRLEKSNLQNCKIAFRT